jgi:CxxC motif-containing protein (DUF1111 family)
MNLIIKEIIKYLLCFSAFSLMLLSSCKEDDDNNVNPTEELSEEYYSGGKLGTVFDEGPLAYELPTPAVEKLNLGLKFLLGEALVENEFNTKTSGVRYGLGPAYVRSSCITCHPGYGHGKRMDRYRATDYGNSYLLVVTDENENYVASLTGMPQTQAVSPFLPPINEPGIKIEWLNHTDEYGNTFPDGETYSLIYPEVTIPREAFNVPMPDYYTVRLEATIGLYGVGLIDAIPDDSIRVQYERASEYTENVKIGREITEPDGSIRLARFTYGLTRATLQNGPGANAIWNITNVTRSDRTSHYMTTAYATAMSQNEDIQKSLGQTESEIYDYLMSSNLMPELSDEDYINFMIWHRGLAVPAARDLDDPTVQQGKAKFYEIGCTSCHRPSWTTGADDYTGDPMVKDKLPRYPNQKIWPYSDYLQHRLEMVNDIRTGWCRTTPLWGRGLSQQCTGASDHLHDMRARNYIEAIMWHGGDAKASKEKFRNLSKEDRNAIIRFLESI